MSGVYQGLKVAPVIYNKRGALCKIYFPYFAKDKWSHHDFENCSEIIRVPGSEKCGSSPKLYKNDLKSGRYRVPKLPPLSVKFVKFAQDESSKHDFKNCSDIGAVTLFRICPILLHFPTFMFFTPP